MSNKKRPKRTRPKGGGKLTTKQLQKSILQLFRANPAKRFTPKQIIAELGLKNNKDAVRHAIERLQADGKLKTVSTLKLKDPDAAADTSRRQRNRRKAADEEAVAKNDPAHAPDGGPAKSRRRGKRREAEGGAAAARAPERIPLTPAQEGDAHEPEVTDHPGDAPKPRKRRRPSTKRSQAPAPQAAAAKAAEAAAAAAPEAPRPLADDELLGTVDLSRSGSGYVVVEGREQDVFVPQRRLGGAMNGDTVRIRFWTPRGRNKPEGEVVEVTDRKVEHFLGSYRDGRKYGIVIPDRVEYEFDVAVMPGHELGAQDGDKVVVKVTQWPERAGRNPRGEVTELLGATGSTDLEMKGILINQGFELRHSEAALEESEAVPEAISPQEAHRRLDLRDVLTFTIDPVDAKDFDDALSYRRLDNGRLEIGVHIADVSHYVREGSALDAEAAKSTTSVYLVDRVLPMLPEKLSNGVCSLRPHEDKCTFSALFEFDDKDVIRRTSFHKTLTHSDRRFTYEQAQDLIEADVDDMRAHGDDEDVRWTEVVQHVNRIAGKLRERRFKNGAIDFDSEEVRFKLDADGQPVDAYVKARRDSNMLVEDFMLLANRSVAAFIARKGKDEEIPLPYRVHDEPDPEKMANLATFAAKFGVDLDLSSPKAVSRSYNRLRKLAAERPELAVLSPLAIRTMAKAEYTTDNIGHYGLGFEFYTHFTSPIRRYADVLVHRVLEKNLGRGQYRADKDALEAHCRHISERERAAVKAERESTSYFQVLYIRDHIGEHFAGTVNGVIERGVFVQLDDNYCEGFVPFETMPEHYELDGARLVATGRSTGRKLQMGSAVTVQIVSADPDTRRIEMSLVEEGGDGDAPAGRAASAKPAPAKRKPTSRSRGRGGRSSGSSKRPASARRGRG